MVHEFKNHITHRLLVEVVVETTATVDETLKGIKRGIFRGLDTPPTMIAAPDKVAVNEADSYLETYFEIVGGIFYSLEAKEPCVARDVYENQGRCALYTLAKQWTDEFEAMNIDRQWDGEWYEELDEFLAQKNDF